MVVGFSMNQRPEESQSPAELIQQMLKAPDDVSTPDARAEWVWEASDRVASLLAVAICNRCPPSRPLGSPILDQSLITTYARQFFASIACTLYARTLADPVHRDTIPLLRARIIGACNEQAQLARAEAEIMCDAKKLRADQRQGYYDAASPSIYEVTRDDRSVEALVEGLLTALIHDLYVENDQARLTDALMTAAKVLLPVFAKII